MVTIILDNQDIHIGCPNCKEIETINVDEQRHHLQNFNIVEWEIDRPAENEKSMMQCKKCNCIFKLEWDYNNH